MNYQNGNNFLLEQNRVSFQILSKILIKCFSYYLRSPGLVFSNSSFVGEGFQALYLYVVLLLKSMSIFIFKDILISNFLIVISLHYYGKILQARSL